VKVTQAFGDDTTFSVRLTLQRFDDVDGGLDSLELAYVSVVIGGRELTGEADGQLVDTFLQDLAGIKNRRRAWAGAPPTKATYEDVFWNLRAAQFFDDPLMRTPVALQRAAAARRHRVVPVTPEFKHSDAYVLELDDTVALALAYRAGWEDGIQATTLRAGEIDSTISQVLEWAKLPRRHP
jgi:hypothetical protein